MKRKKEQIAPRALSSLAPGESATVFETPARNMRLAELGLIRGEKVTLVKVAPLGDPVILHILDSSVMVRRADIADVLVI